MKRPSKKTIRKVIRRIHKQDIYEICRTLEPVSDHLEFIIASFCIIPPRGYPYTDYPISAKEVYGALLTEDYAFILCNNGVLHIFGCVDKEYWLFFEKPWKMLLRRLCWSCCTLYRNFVEWIQWHCT